VYSGLNRCLIRVIIIYLFDFINKLIDPISDVPTLDVPVINSLPKLLDQVHDKLRRKHYSIRTKRAYVDWIKRHILIHGKRASRHVEWPLRGKRLAAQKLGAGDTAATGFLQLGQA